MEQSFSLRTSKRNLKLESLNFSLNFKQHSMYEIRDINQNTDSEHRFLTITKLRCTASTLTHLNVGIPAPIRPVHA